MYGPGPTGSVETMVEVTLYDGSGATICTAGFRWKGGICLDEAEPLSVMGVGSQPLTLSTAARRIFSFL